MFNKVFDEEIVIEDYTVPSELNEEERKVFLESMKVTYDRKHKTPAQLFTGWIRSTSPVYLRKYKSVLKRKANQGIPYAKEFYEFLRIREELKKNSLSS